MSWSISSVGKVYAVVAQVADLVDSGEVLVHIEPERQLRRDIGDLIGKTLAAYPDEAVVRVDASGSQYTPDFKAPEKVINTLSLKVEVIYGFVG